MNVSLEILEKISASLDIPDGYFYVKCPRCQLPSFFNLCDTHVTCKVLPEYGGCGDNSVIDLVSLHETTGFQSMVELRIKEWLPIRKRLMELKESLPVPSERFRVEDTRFIRFENGNYVLIHKDEKVFDGFGINPKLKHGLIKEIV